MKIFYSPDYVLSAYAFDTTRKAQWLADSLVANPIGPLELIAPEPLSVETLVAVHDPQYVEAIRTGKPRSLAATTGLRWNPLLWPMVLTSNGGVVAAVRAALQDRLAGSLSSGLHHAHYDHGSGFCTFNGLAIGARAALQAGARALLILDCDAHCGGGTHALVAAEEAIWHTDISTHPFDFYQPQGHNTLDMIDSAADYLPTLAQRLTDLERDAPPFDLCIYNAGVDPAERCTVGGLAGITREILLERERMVFAWCARRNIAVAFVLAGGYVGRRLNRVALVALHRQTIEAAFELHSIA